MFRFINFLISLCVLVVLVIGAFWYVTTPQPAKMQDQMTFALDTAIFNLHLLKQQGDAEKAASWRDLARTGNSAAELYQAQLLFREAKKNPDAYKEAVTILDKLAVKGIPEGQNAYGVLLRDGLGLEADRIEAYKWFHLAAERGSKLAEENLLNLSHLLTAAQITEGDNRASSWLLDYLNSK